MKRSRVRLKCKGNRFREMSRQIDGGRWNVGTQEEWMKNTNVEERTRFVASSGRSGSMVWNTPGNRHYQTLSRHKGGRGEVDEGAQAKGGGGCPGREGPMKGRVARSRVVQRMNKGMEKIEMRTQLGAPRHRFQVKYLPTSILRYGARIAGRRRTAQEGCIRAGTQAMQRQRS
jgi:hypothetical protein